MKAFRKTGHVFTARSGTNSTGSAAPLPPPPARTAGRTRWRPLPILPSSPGPSGAQLIGMRQRLLERRFVPCWAGRSAGLGRHPAGVRLSRGRGHCWSGLAFPQAEGPAAEAPPPRRAPRHSSGPPSRSDLIPLRDRTSTLCPLTEGSAVWRIFPCFI